MKIQNKYIIGTHIMFYEIEMVVEHVYSIINAIKTVDNRTIGIKDLLWEFFQGSKGKPPKVIVERLI